MSDTLMGFSGPATANDPDLFALLASLGSGRGSADLDKIIGACPRVLIGAWQIRFSLSAETLDALRAYRTGLDEGTRLWPWGIGPLEQLFEGLDRVFSLETARSLAASPLVTGSLSRPYLEAACEHVYAVLNSNDLRRARRLHEVLLAAVASDIADDAAHCRALVWRTWLAVAKTVLGQLPDDALFTSASDVEASLLSLADSLGDMALACDTRYGFAAVLIAPYTAGDSMQFDVDIRRWRVRGIDAGLPDADVIPGPESAFKLAEGRLRRALDDAVNGRLEAEGRIRALLATVLFRWHKIKTEKPLRPGIVTSIANEAESALAALPSADLNVRLEMHMILSALGRPSDMPEVESICREPVDDLIARYGPHDAFRIVMLETQALAAYQPDLALLYLASLEGFQRALPEHLRALFLRLHARTILGGNTAEHARSFIATLPPDERLDGEGLLKALGEQAGRGGWTPAEFLRCVLFVASPDVIVPEDVLSVLDWATRLAPVFAGQHRDAISYLAAGRATDTASTVYSLVGEGGPESDGDPAAAVACFIEALRRSCDLALADKALECLDVLRNIVFFGGQGMAELVIRALPGRLGQLEALGGEQALQVIAMLTDICVASLLNEGNGGPVLEALLWGKGHAFASAQAIGATFEVSQDEEAIEMLTKIREIETELGPAADVDDGLDDRRLLAPYLAAQEERAETGSAQVLRNLQHSFDEHVERKVMTAALSGDTPARRTWRWSVDEVIGSVPDKTAFMILYLSEISPARLVAATLTSEQIYLTYQPISTPDASGDAEGSALELIQMTTHYVRDTVQKDPGPRVVDRDSGMLLEHSMISFLGPAVDLLADLSGRGYDHLVVVPDGPLHYFPIHLFGPPGKPLSDHWLVTFQPSLLSVVTADEQPRRRRTAGASVLGIDFRDYPAGPIPYEPLEGVAEEVRAVTAAVGAGPC